MDACAASCEWRMQVQSGGSILIINALSYLTVTVPAPESITHTIPTIPITLVLFQRVLNASPATIEQMKFSITNHGSLPLTRSLMPAFQIAPTAPAVPADFIINHGDGADGR